jgi:hypothetical protein
MLYKQCVPRTLHRHAWRPPAHRRKGVPVLGRRHIHIFHALYSSTTQTKHGAVKAAPTMHAQ